MQKFEKENNSTQIVPNSVSLEIIYRKKKKEIYVYMCMCDGISKCKNWNNLNYPKLCIIGNYISQEEKEKCVY